MDNGTGFNLLENINLDAAGNFTTGKFILRGLRTGKAPHLGSQDIIQFIGSQDFAAAGSAETIGGLSAYLDRSSESCIRHSRR